MTPLTARAALVPARLPRERRGVPVAVVATRAAAAAPVAAGLGWTVRNGLEEPRIALAFGAIVALGELVGFRPAGRAEPRTGPAGAPLATAGALAYALFGERAGSPAGHGVLQITAVVFTATLAGGVPHIARGRPDSGGLVVDHLSRRVLATWFAATCFQPLFGSGTLGRWLGRGPYYALYLVLVLALTALCDAVLAAALARARTGWPYGALLRDELRALAGIGSAMCATGAVMALATAVAGLWALPVFSLPLLLTQLSFRRYAAVRTTYRQTIASLARATEIAGYTRPGHARRVAVLSRAVGRELGLPERELDVLEQAALMHDIGQLSLLDPVPDGATEPLPGVEQRRIALLGGAVARQTGVAPEVAVIVERQAEPYRDQPVAARIVRAANAYDDLSARTIAAGSPVEGPLRALERLRLATAAEYDPRVVAALYGVLARPWEPSGGPAGTDR